MGDIINSPIVETREHQAWRLSIMDGGREASRVRVVDRRLRIGQSSLRFGGIADVFTDPAHRKKGLGGRLMTAAVELMKRQGHHFSMLFGIRNYYEKWGYRSSLADYNITIAGRSVLGDVSGWEIRDLTPDEYVLTLPIYKRWLDNRAFGVERRKGAWIGFTMGSRFHTRPRPVGLWRAGKLHGYMVLDQAEYAVNVSELTALSPQGYRALLAWLGLECQRLIREHISIELPHCDVVGQMAVSFDDTEYKRKINATGNGMNRIIDFTGLMTELHPELARRWQHSHLKDAALRLTVQTDMGRHVLLFGRAAAEEKNANRTMTARISLPQDRLMQLILGYRHCRQIAGDEGVKLPARLLPTLDVLFPVGCAHILRTDLF